MICKVSYGSPCLRLNLRDSSVAQYAQTLARLEHADAQVDDLKEQLDDALGAEDMLVQLTERNLLMGEVRPDY